jgi:hypothetical protein
VWDEYELDMCSQEKSTNDLRESLRATQGRLAAEDAQTDSMWSVLRKAFDYQMKMRARIYERKDPSKKTIDPNDHEAVVTALLQEAVRKFPEK